MAQSLHFDKYIIKFTTMKLLSTYQNLKRKSVELLSNGVLDEYFEVLIKLSHLEKQMIQLSLLN